jgi:DNA-binding NarL/FixJ family response regulator
MTTGSGEILEEVQTQPMQIIITDDHALVRDGLRSMLEDEPGLEVVGEAANGREALELCRSLKPDLVLMDVRMPEMDGLAATRAIKGDNSATSVLMVTTYENPNYLLEAIKAGAAGYVLKDAPRGQLLGTVRKVLGGEFPLDQELAMRLLWRLADEARQQAGLHRSPRKHREQLAEPLTARELQVVRHLPLGGPTSRPSESWESAEPR